VVSTIKDSIIDPARIGDGQTFVWLMMAALLAGALWLNVATALGAPVSTTHSIVGGVLGAGIAAGGMSVANWDVMGRIVISWFVSPVLGGLVAAAFLYLIKRTITYQNDLLGSAQRVVPVLLAVMAWSFATYLMLKGLSRIFPLAFGTAAFIGAAVAVLVFLASRVRIGRLANRLPNQRESVAALFNLPLVFAAALLSFAHGANDVANAIGPLAAINDVLLHGAVSAKAAVPLWVMMIGAVGIALGLSLYGGRVIRTIGSEITELDQIRAFCIAMSAALTVIVASQLGLPVSSTHIAVGGVFGVGFLREYLKVSYSRMIAEIESHHDGADREVLERYLDAFEAADMAEKGQMLKRLRVQSAGVNLSKRERKSLKKVYKEDLVKRSLALRIVAAWLITVPVSASLAALIFFMLRGMLMP
jgi:PiT family inorganic phosphate transporter